MIIVVPSCLKDANGARTCSDQKPKTPTSGAKGGPQCFWGVSIPFFISFLRYLLNIGLCNPSGPLLLLSREMLG